MIHFLIKNLAYFPSFKKAMLEFAFLNQSKSYKENLEVAFFDSKGRVYSRFNDYKKMPLKRLEQINKMQEVIRDGMGRGKGTYLADWVQTAKKVIEESKTPKAEFGKLLYALEERGKLFDENLLIELACLTYIRDDENPNEFSEALHKEKIEQITKDLKQKAGGLYDFFQQAGLAAYLPSGVGTAIDYEEFTAQSQKKIQKMTEELQKTTSLLKGLSE